MKKILKSILIITGLVTAMPYTYAQVSVGVSISARIAPPAIPVYVQPECPVDGYIWTPGYWAYNNYDNDYYWVPGVWVAPPEDDYLWTPPYWAYVNGYYGFHPGYWGLHVGYYGGINYGYGYGGDGYYGGMWSGGRFRYNTAITRVNTRIVHNTYINNNYVHNNNHYSFNGPGGATARPSRQDQLAARDRHIQPTRNQLAHQSSARSNRSQFASVNHGRPAVASMARVNSNRLNQQGRHSASATSRTTNRMGAARSRNAPMAERRTSAPQRNFQSQRQTNFTRQRSERSQMRQNAGYRQQAQQQRMASRPQMQQRPQREQRMVSRPQMQQQRPQREQRMEARPMGGGGGGQRAMGGGGRPMGGGGGGNRGEHKR